MSSLMCNNKKSSNPVTEIVPHEINKFVGEIKVGKYCRHRYYVKHFDNGLSAYHFLGVCFVNLMHDALYA